MFGVSDTSCVERDSGGTCTRCVEGFTIDSATLTCSKITVVVQQDPYCRTVSQNGSCIECYQQYYLLNGKCVQANPLCSTSNSSNGQCLSCWGGYVLSGGNCVISNDPNCRVYSNSACSECSNRYYVGSNGICVAVSTQCATYNNRTGECLTCYSGYTISNGQCVVVRQNLNCKTFRDNVCIECSQTFYLDGSTGLCIAQNPSCQSVDSNGRCTSCYKGYTLQNGGCFIPRNSDPYCDQPGGNICLHCVDGYWISKGVCVPVTKNCLTYDQGSGDCLGCTN